MPSSQLSNGLETSPLIRDARALMPLASLEAHWSSTERSFAGSGGLVSGDQLAELLRRGCEASDVNPPGVQPVSLVARWIVSQSVVTLDSPWGLRLPLFQFDLPRAAVHAAVAPLLSELRGAFETSELALWFVTPNDWLGGKHPADLMHTDLNAVRQAARSDRFVAVGF